MAQWYHLFCLLSVMCMSFGALYIVFNSDYNEVCDYSGTVDSCDERKVYRPTDVAWEKKKLHNDWLFQAQELRNQSEKMKCDTERDLLQDLQDMEKAEAERIVTKCLADFRACVASGFKTTTPGPIETDCTSCNRFCTMTNWDNIDPSYAIAMGFTGVCSKTVCPWLPECGVGKYIHEKCSMRGCTCDKVPCPTTTPDPLTPAPSPSTTSTTLTTLTPTTVTATTASTTAGSTTTTTAGTTTTSTTSTSTTTTSTSTTWTTVTSTTSTSTTSTSTTSTSTTITTTVITTTTLTTTTTASTTTSTIACICPVGLADTVIVGRPYKTFFQPKDHVWTASTARLMQGVNVKTDQALPIGGMLTQSCSGYFSDRMNYFGPQQHVDPIAREEARNSHFDLGCGYSGNFNVKCSATGSYTCALEVDISTCVPPTFTQALDDCYAAVMTTLPPYVGVEAPKVPDWLGVEVLNFSVAELPAFFNITTQTTTARPCCEVHVGSVCRPDINFDHPLVGKTVQGRWQPQPSYNRTVGYFPVVPCDQQAKSVPRPCPRVKINQISAAYTQWPHCMSVCNAASAQKEFAQICNRTANDMIETKEEAAHKAKIDIQKAKSLELEQWTQQRMTTVLEEKHVFDCFDDKLPRRYNSMSLPKMRSGFSTMPLHNQCRLHGCKVNQCLQVKKKCKVPFVNEAPEVMCNVPAEEGQFLCVDKVEISTNNPLSFGFGIAWMAIGVLFVCCCIASYVRSDRSEGNPERDTMALAVAPI